mgnify:FL=1
MEVIEIISSYVNKSNNILKVEFKVLNNDNITSDTIEYHYVEEFGYNIDMTMDVFDDYDSDFDEMETWNDEVDEVDESFIDEETLISFLNEYYVVFPDKKPDEEYN